MLLLAPQAHAQVEIEVTSRVAPLMGGSRQIATLARGSRFVVQNTNGAWQLVTAQTAEGQKSGWMHRDHTRQLFLPPRRPILPTRPVSGEMDQILRQVKEIPEDKPAERARAQERYLLLAYQSYGSEAIHAAATEFLLALDYMKLGRYYEAEQFMLHAVKVFENNPDERYRAALLEILHALCKLYADTGRLSEWDTVVTRRAALAERFYGTESPEFVAAELARAALLSRRGAYAQITPIYKRLIAVAERLKDDRLLARTTRDLGQNHLQLRHLDEAKQYLEQALKYEESHADVDTHATAHIYKLLAEIERERGAYAQSEALYRRGLKVLDGTGNPLSEAELLMHLGNTLTMAGNYSAAEAALLQALELRQSILGADSVDVADVRTELGRLYSGLRLHGKALEQLERALPVLESHQGTNHKSWQIATLLMASVYRKLGRLDEATELLLRVIESQRRSGGVSWQALNMLAGVYRDSGQFVEAQPLYEQAVALAERQVGPEHPDLGLLLDHWADLHLAQGADDKAEPLLQRAARILQQQLGDHSNVLGVTLNTIALCYGRAGRWDEAVSTFERVQRIDRYNVRRTLPALSDQERRDFLLQSSGRFAIAMTAALARPGDAASVERAAEWLLNRKALINEALAEQTLLAREATTPELAELVRETQRVRQELAAATLASAPIDDRRRHMQQLNQRLDDLQRWLGRAADRAGVDDRDWVELKAVRAAIPPDAVLIEIALVYRWDFAGPLRSQVPPSEYVAWIIPPAGNGQVQVVKLGPVDDLDKPVFDHLKQVQSAAADIRALGEAEAERRMNENLQRIAQLLLRPMQGEISGKRHWIISPDSMLWGVPWAALPLEDGRYAIEHHLISYLTSGRNLVEQAPTEAVGSLATAVVFADPNFNLDPELAAAELRVEPDGLLLASRGPLMDAAVRVPKNWSRLPGTAAEAAATLPSLKKYVGAEPTAYTGNRALEGRLKQVQRPRVLVLSTHGYFLKDPEPQKEVTAAADTAADNTATADTATAEAADPTLPDNPLLRCGLVMAGANRRDQSVMGIDDGIVTGLEIVGTDLRGTELVVLSACETAVGVVTVGEGVAGLQQAFHLAGARSTLATMWSIPDRETAQLMSLFWQHLAQKKSKAEALQAAQIAMIAARRNANGGAHPWFWAAFTLSGSSD